MRYNPRINFVLLVTVLCLTHMGKIQAQDAASFFNRGVEKMKADSLDAAIDLFTKTIELEPTNYYAWLNRGIAKSWQREYETALKDLDEVVKLAPDYKKGFLNRGTAKKYLTDYDGAIADYNKAIELDSNYAEAYYIRGVVYEMLGKKDEACRDYKTAKKKGSGPLEKKMEKCSKDDKPATNYYSILRLTKTATSDKYGFTEKDPIKVGCGPDGGPANQKAYLDLLRDKQGKAIRYERSGSCCMYDSPNGILGKGMLDKYRIVYLNEKNEWMESVLYISFDDYEELKIPMGFKTVGQK